MHSYSQISLILWIRWLHLQIIIKAKMVSLWLHLGRKIVIIAEQINNPRSGFCIFFCNVCKRQQKHYIGYIRNEYISVNESERVNENWCHFCDLCTKFSRSNQFRTKPCPTELTKPFLHFYVIYHSAEK